VFISQGSRRFLQFTKAHSKTTKICDESAESARSAGEKLSAIFFPADLADSADSSQINFVEWSIDIPFRRNLCGFSAPSAKICGKYFKHYLFPAEDTDNAE